MKIYSLRLLNLLLIMATTFHACKDKTPKLRKKIDPAFGAYITAYTSGLVSKKSSIVIKLASPIKESLDFTTPIDKKLFDFDPSIGGEAYWKDNQTIEFVPEEDLPSGKAYEASFDLSKLFSVKDQYEDFEFGFQVIKQDFDVYIDGLSSYKGKNLDRQQLKGKVVFADFTDPSRIAEILKVKQSDQELNINWISKSDKQYEFVVDSIVRTDDAGEIALNWNGESIGVDKEDLNAEIEVPALGDFKVTKVQVIQRPEQYIEVRFSDPIQQQNLDGMIEIEDVDNLDYILENENVLKIYPRERITGTRDFEIAEGIKNINGSKMPDSFEKELVFEQIKPAARIVGKGVIIPNSNGLIFPFEAVSLRAVDLYVTQIFEDNVIQFFQGNNFDGSYHLNRVGRNVVKKRINLEKLSKSNLFEWNRFYIDLADLLIIDPGAIYRVELRFKKEYSIYGCEGELEPLDDFEFSTDDGWEVTYDYNEYWDDYYYDWDHREDPCHVSYYSQYNSVVSKNIIASNIGLIGKIGADKKVHIIANDIVSTQPLSGVKIEVYDYQQQLIAQASTNSEGTVTIDCNRKPFIAIASDDKQRGYLKLDDGNALSMSKFDVSGATVNKGIKGKLYGERGVWRPGDSLYLTFVMEDKENILPVNHPVNFELINPQGQIVKRIVKTAHTNGFYDFRTATTPDAITGNYTGKVSVGNRTYSKYLKIETVKPNRLKIYVDFGGKMIKSGSDPDGELEVKWLHGATAGNLKAKVDMTVSKTKTAFKKFKSYHFDDVSNNFSSDEFTVFDGKLNDQGKATISPGLSYEHSAPGMIRASFNTKVFEPGGNFSVDRFSMLYSPYSSYVGFDIPKGNLWGDALETKKDHVVDIVTVNEDGKLIDQDDVEVKLYKINWSWWWDSYGNDVVDFLGRSSTRLIETESVDTEKGRAQFKFSVDHDDWGRYLLMVKDPKSGHISSKTFYMDTPYWARSNRNNAENATMLGFSSDKETYTVGENVKVTFPSPEGGRALVCIENGTKVIEKYWVETDEGETKFEFPVSEEMTPNVYCNITLLQPHEMTENDQPIRMFGVIPLLVENPGTHIHPVIKTQEVFRPESKTRIKVEEKDGKDMTYTLAIVDEGLLDLTRFKTPDLWQHFYAREALGVKTWDLYDYIMGAYGGELDKLLAVGGDEDGGKKKNKKANRFKPMVKFLGPFALDGGDEAEHEIEIPNYIGSVRVMVVAGQDSKYGKAEKAVPVRKPLMVLGTLPRVLSPGETVQLPVNVFAMEQNIKNVKVEVVPNEFFQLTDTKSKSLQFAKTGDKVVNFELKVADKLGVGKVQIKATSGNTTATYEVELDIRTPNPPTTRIIDTLIQANQAWELDYEFFGIDGTNRGILEVSTMPSMNLAGRLNYLIRYPHGCVEQTTSSVFPQLYLSNIMELNDEQKEEIEFNIKQGIDKLRHFQLPNGGFSYWPGNSYTSDWGSNYASHFLLEAEKKGYALPIGMKNDMLSYHRDVVRNWSSTSHNYSNHQLIHAYRLFVLALANQPELGAMNRLRELPTLTPRARWRLAAAYQLAGQPEIAKEMIFELDAFVKPYREMSYSFGSNIRDEAMILETLSLLKEWDKAAPLAIQLAAKANSKQWMSTQTTAYVLIGMSSFIGSKDEADEVEFEIQLTGKEDETVETERIIFRTQLNADQRKGRLKFKNESNTRLYAKLILEGVSTSENQKESAENIGLKISYEDMDGNSISVNQLKQSTDFIAEVEIYNPGLRGNLKELALNQLFPSGWEIINSRMAEGPSTIGGSEPTYQDIRDDRVYTYFDLNSRERKKFRIQLNATYMGKFFLPGIACEAMYDNSISAYQPGKWIEVIQAD